MNNDRDALDFDLGQAILTTYSADGFLGIGVDVPGQEQAGTSTFDARFPYGTFCRPRDPDVSTDQTRRIGATTLYGYAGTSRHAWPLDDPRVTPKLPQAPKGTWGAYADTGRDELPVMVLDGATGSYALRVPHSTGGGVASVVLVDVETPGAEEITLAHGAGAMLQVLGDAVEVKNAQLHVGNNQLTRRAVVINTQAFAAWIAAVSGVTGVAAPPIYTSTTTFVE